ncbi:hypothetical protein [Streptomyces nodosus]|uniref:hypothetical protein n=1 Tax=Streptomyces nodosus TaxID=40318 RepID=UPI00381EABA3
MPLPPGPGPARKEASRRAALRAAVTTTADVAVYAPACVLLVEGEFLLSMLVRAVAVVVFRFSTAAAMAPTRTS